METNAETTPAQDAAPGDLAAELEAARAKAEENYNKFLYAMADFENYKKRIERQFADIAIAGKRSALAKFLPVIDNLERALGFEGDSEGLRGGLQATLKGFEGILASEGVKPIRVKGQPFDPKIAEAIGTQPARDVPNDTVVEEVQKGYMIGDELLRPAQVIVCKNE
ncbi:MAG TPA: nucleotide exchange factor GrpE [Candidatus Binatia bacterium]|nr:nucleotide exchange factor GrpE [Candidatus Binatia bacterium]